MLKKSKILLIIVILINLFNFSYAKENLFNEAKKKYDLKKFEDSKFLFQRNIVFNPKDSKSYLYLAKIYNSQENQKEEEKNLKTTLLLEPDNEEAMFMLINIELKRSNYSKVKKLINNFKIICSKLCKKVKNFNEELKNIEPKNET